MSDPEEHDDPEYVGEVELVREEVDVAGYDQAHAKAFGTLRKTEAFILFTHLQLPAGLFGITYTHLVPTGDEYRNLRLAFADTLEKVAEEIRRA